MSWNLEGRYFENCSCEVPCPCTASLSLGADYDQCRLLLAFHVDSGEVDGVDVSGLTVAAVAETPKVMSEGNWRLGLVIDDQASEEQAEKLAGVFSGQLGGPMEALGPLLGEVLGVERAAIDFSSEGGRHSVKVGDDTQVEGEDVVPFGSETGEPVRMDGVFHPAASTLTVGKAGSSSRVKAFGLEFENPGKSMFSAPFSWAA